MMVTDEAGSSHSDFFRLFFYSFLGDVAHVFDVLELYVLVDFPIFLQISPKVDGCLHRRYHE